MVRALLAGLFWLAAGPAAAECRLALLLALDVSSSVDAGEYALQREGVADALLAPEVQAAILGGEAGVALAAYEWSGRRQSAVVLDWVMLRDAGDIAAAAAVLRGAKRSETRFPTAMGFALGFGAGLLRRAPVCDRQVIDVSGDGVTNDGFPPRLAYKHFPFDGVVVNGLAVLGADPQVEAYYRDEVRFGPGAFVETAQGYAGYRAAMARKLFRELGGMQVGAAR
ncbi:DUF1194 domain-containing protein [Thalassococcus arenae]|uniref:DUF1194 domain-containing protein n=1 Tax=Thalassococcus arenae TaxID=2851652 RepID=UPI0020CB20DC|nr:DUF1194 domain-containing protein [Thalassococcus arenae]